MSTTINRSVWIDGSGGTVIGNAQLQGDIYDKFDQAFAGGLGYETFVFGGKVKVEGTAGSNPAIDANGSLSGTNSVRVRNGTAGSVNTVQFQLDCDAGNVGVLIATSSTFVTSSEATADMLLLRSARTGGLGLSTIGSAPIRFCVNQAEKGRFHTNGFFGIGVTNPGANLHVVGGANTFVQVTGSSGNTKVALGSAVRQYHLNSASDGAFYVADDTAAQNRAFWDTSGNFAPAADNTYKLGLSANRWLELWVNDAHFGDVNFDNGFRFTEHDKLGLGTKGIGLVGPDGRLMAFFDHRGDLHLRGLVRDGSGLF